MIDIKNMTQLFKLMKKHDIQELELGESIVIKRHIKEPMSSKSIITVKPKTKAKKFDLDQYAAEQVVKKSIDDIIDDDPNFELFQRGQFNFNKDS